LKILLGLVVSCNSLLTLNILILVNKCLTTLARRGRRSYTRDPHSAAHRTLTGEANPPAHWRFGWIRSQCTTVAQLRTGNCPLHCIGREQSPVCPACGAHRTRRQAQPPTTSTQLILDACGPSWSQLGPWQAPWPGM